MEEETDVSRKRAAPFSGEDGTRTLARQPNPNPCPSVLLLYSRVTAQTWGLPLVAGSTFIPPPDSGLFPLPASLCPRQKDEEEKRGEWKRY